MKQQSILLRADAPQHKYQRNEPCPCGSGKKAKRCCIRKSELAKKAALEDAYARRESRLKRERQHTREEEEED